MTTGYWMIVTYMSNTTSRRFVLPVKQTPTEFERIYCSSWLLQNLEVFTEI